jgi:Tfp pilus assembly protein PilV
MRRRQVPSHPSAPREAGISLLEVAIAVPVLAVGVLGFLFALQNNFRLNREVIADDIAEVAFTNALETIRATDFEDIYSTYSGTTIAYSSNVSASTGVDDVASLVTSGGVAASVQVACFVDETALPSEFGPVMDLDGDGALTSTDCSTTYFLLPVRLTLTYQSGSTTMTRQLFVTLSNNN